MLIEILDVATGDAELVGWRPRRSRPCLSGVLMLRSGYTVPIGKWPQRAVVFAAALTRGWLGALVAAAIFVVYRNRSPDTKDAILLACLSVGSFFA